MKYRISGFAFLPGCLRYGSASYVLYRFSGTITSQLGENLQKIHEYLKDCCIIKETGTEVLESDRF